MLSIGCTPPGHFQADEGEEEVETSTLKDTRLLVAPLDTVFTFHTSSAYILSQSGKTTIRILPLPVNLQRRKRCVGIYFLPTK
jgi:hypothetical protein